MMLYVLVNNISDMSRPFYRLKTHEDQMACSSTQPEAVDEFKT